MSSASVRMAAPAATATTPTSVPGNSHVGAAAGGFTLIELMIVVALVALAAGIISLALPDPASRRLDIEATRLSALLESARAESRASGRSVRWMPLQADGDADFRFVGLPDSVPMPTRWLEPSVRAEVGSSGSVVLGPEPLIGAQRIVLRLGDQRIDLSTDGLGAFQAGAEEVRP